MKKRIASVIAAIVLGVGAQANADVAPDAPAGQQEPATRSQSAEDLAKQLANPVAALISVPLQLNYDQHIGPGDAGDRWSLNVQPVIPF